MGAVLGLFNGEGQPVATKFLLPVGVTAGYYIDKGFLCGIVVKDCIIPGVTTVFLTGFKIAACF